MPVKKTTKAKANEDKNKKTTKKKTSKKSPTKKRTKTSSTTKRKTSPKKKPVKTVVVDVISNEEEEITEEQKPEMQDKLEEVDIENLDTQKKYYSELISEIKEKQKKVGNKEYDKKAKSIKLYRRIIIQFSIIVLFVLLVIVYFVGTKLTVAVSPAAEVFSDSIQFEVVSSQEAETSLPSSQVVPGELIEAKVESEKVYNTSGEEKIGEEVVGEVIIYNQYSRSQPLIATTRLLTPDQKLFRISEDVNVPAGSSVRVEAYADTVSADMAISPTRMTIPGLWAGLQDQIYAENPEPFVYRTQINHFVRQSDLDFAINDIRSELKDKLYENINWQMRPGDGVVYDIDENRSILNINAELGDEVEDFVVRAENQAIVVRFSKQKAEELLQAKIAFSLPTEKELINFNPDNIKFSLNDYNLEDGTALVTASYTGSTRLKGDFDLIDKNKLTNLSKDQIKLYLDTFNEISDYQLRFSPSFLKRAPHLSDRIEIKLID